MRFKTQVIIVAGSLMTASPALAQNAAEPVDNAANATGVDANVAATPAPATALPPTGAAAAPATQPATLPPAGDPTIDTAYTQGDDDGGRFPWGVLGVLGLLGLLGRRRRNRVIGDGTNQ